jgi:hypothetical protein
MGGGGIVENSRTRAAVRPLLKSLEYQSSSTRPEFQIGLLNRVRHGVALAECV